MKQESTKAKPKRRMGARGSPVWTTILDAAEDILREEGYGSLSSRNIANRVGVNQQLVYYYFVDMDDLIVSTFLRASKRELAKIDEILTSGQAIYAVWQEIMHTKDNRLVAEYAAMTAHSPKLRDEVVLFIQKLRQLQTDIFRSVMANQHPLTIEISPEALVVIANSVAQALTWESELGISDGHAAAESVIENILRSYEAPSR